MAAYVLAVSVGSQEHCFTCDKEQLNHSGGNKRPGSRLEFSGTPFNVPPSLCVTRNGNGVPAYDALALGTQHGYVPRYIRFSLTTPKEQQTEKEPLPTLATSGRMPTVEQESVAVWIVGTFDLLPAAKVSTAPVDARWSADTERLPRAPVRWTNGNGSPLLERRCSERLLPSHLINEEQQPKPSSLPDECAATRLKEWIRSASSEAPVLVSEAAQQFDEDVERLASASGSFVLKTDNASLTCRVRLRYSATAGTFSFAIDSASVVLLNRKIK